MRILLYKDKLVEEIGHVQNERVVFLRYVRREDMPKCKCGEAIDEKISIIEGCRNWESEIEGVETILTKFHD